VTTSRNGKGVNFEFNEREEAYGSGSVHNKNSPLRRNSGNSSMMDAGSGSVLAVKATISKEQQPSITGSNDSTSLDSRSYIAPFHAHDHDVESNASLIPAPRSTTVSVTSSLENVHMKSASSHNVCASLPEVENQPTLESSSSKGESLSSIVQQHPSSPTITSSNESELATQQIVAPCAVPEESSICE